MLFRSTCQTSWGLGNRDLTEKLATITGSLKSWAKQRTSPQNRLQQLQTLIHNHQMLHPTLQNSDYEAKLLEEYHRVEDELQEYWRQRARIQWQVEGDRNTAFFHAVATQRRRINLITQVENAEGIPVAQEALIRRTFVQYFKDIYCPQQSGQYDHPLEYIEQCAALGYAKISDQDQLNLTTAPTEAQIRETLFSMGPDKAPGPDGMTARFLQSNWELMKRDITVAIQQVFQTGTTPAAWLASKMILIPKVKDPKTPKDYRPITIGNIIYRLLMKIIANKLQPHMGRVISKNQTAFLKGRSIADNTILMKEVVHSFNMSAYKEEAFLLKADINKAFDMVRWEFVEEAMRAIGIPARLVTIVMSAMARSKVTIHINGQGDGFITPTRGLRQGCPLSPYLFILSMEFLTKHIQLAVQSRSLKGLKLATTAPILTSLIYADDLMLMGKTTQPEIMEFKRIMSDFAKVSGLAVNPSKSKVWFSAACVEDDRQRVLGELGAQLAEDNEKYLGIITSQNDHQLGLTHDLLFEKISATCRYFYIGRAHV